MHHPNRPSRLARQAARAIGLRVAAVDMFVDIGGKPDANEIIEVNSNPSIRLLEDSDRGDLILKIWHHTFPPWDCCSVRSAEIRRRHLPRAHGRIAGRARSRSRAAAAHLGGGDRLERQGQHGGDVRPDRPRLWPAHRPVHLAASLPFQRTDSGRRRRDRRRGIRPPEAAGRSRHRRGLETARRDNSARSKRCSRWPACTSRKANAISRCSRPASAGATIRSAWSARTQTCVTSVDYEHVELLGNSLELIASDKSDACAAGGTIVYGENCQGLRPHLVEYNRGRGCTPLFVRDDIRIDNEVAVASGQRFDFRFGDHDFRSSRTEPARRVPVQQCRHCRHAVPALAAARAAAQGCRSQIEAAIRAGLRDTRWPGRLEVIDQDPLTVIDVGHTPDGIRQSLASLTAIHGADDWILVTGASARQEGGRNRRRAGAVVRYDHLHGSASQGRGRAGHRRRGAACQSRRPIFMSPRRLRTQCGSQELARARKRKILRGRRAVSGDRVCDCREGRPCGGFEVFLSSSCRASCRASASFGAAERVQNVDGPDKSCSRRRRRLRVITP